MKLDGETPSDARLRAAIRTAMINTLDTIIDRVFLELSMEGSSEDTLANGKLSKLRETVKDLLAQYNQGNYSNSFKQGFSTAIAGVFSAENVWVKASRLVRSMMLIHITYPDRSSKLPLHQYPALIDLLGNIRKVVVNMLHSDEQKAQLFDKTLDDYGEALFDAVKAYDQQRYEADGSNGRKRYLEMEDAGYVLRRKFGKVSAAAAAPVIKTSGAPRARREFIKTPEQGGM